MPTSELTFESSNYDWNIRSIDETVGSETDSGQLAIFNGSDKIWGLTQHGYVLKKNNPAFNVYGTSGDRNQFIQFTTARFDNTNSFDLSTGKFTVPIQGLYHFSFEINFALTPSTFNRPLFNINGTTSAEFGDSFVQENSNARSSGLAMTFKLEVGDTVGIYILGGNRVNSTDRGAFSGFFIG